MPKRSSQEKINYYSAKIKRLQSKEQALNQKKKRSNRVIVYSSSDSEDNLDNGTHKNSIANTPPTPSRTASPPAAELDDAAPAPPSSPPPPPPTPPPPSVTTESDLDSDLLEALGIANEDIAVYGPEIHTMLAKRWLPILKKGLTTEIKEKLIKEYAVPENCKLLKAPTVNPELSAAVPDIAKNRDKKIKTEQDQLGLGITAVNRAMTVLLTQQDNKVEAVRILSDGCRILCDLHYTQTEVRKKLITRGLDKAFLTNIQEQERDETLFGISLPDKIKESKAIEKQSKDIKKTPVPRVSTSNVASQRPVTRSRFQGNWPGPSRYQAPSRGGRNSQYRSQYQYRGGPPTLAPPAFPAPHPAARSSTTTPAGSRRAPTRH